LPRGFSEGVEGFFLLVLAVLAVVIPWIIVDIP
jgi:hypothetical protein